MVFPIIDEELVEEEEVPLVKKRRRSGISSAEGLTVMSQDEGVQEMGPDLPHFEPVAAVKRREKRRKLVLSPDEAEDRQVLPPTQVVVQEAAVAVNPAETVEFGTKTTSPEVNATVAVLETPKAKEVEIPAGPVTTPAVNQELCPILDQGEGPAIAETSSLSGSAQEDDIAIDSAAGRAFLKKFKSADEACKPIKAELDQLLNKLESPGFQVLQNLEMLLRMKTLLQRTYELKPFLASTRRF